MKNEITLGQRLRYRFDNIMSAGPIALIAWLAVLSLVLIAITALIIFLANAAPTDEAGNKLGFFPLMWFALMRTLDAGTMGGDEGAPMLLIASLFVTLGGIFIVSTLIGILNNGIESKLDELRKGRSLVVEQDHTAILGWSDQIFSVISELCIANENRPKACIAVLADKDKVEMEDEIRAKVPNTGKTKIVCRTGSPIDITDLHIVNPGAARSVIILSDEADDPDSLVIKTILALTNGPDRPDHPYHITAEIRDPQNYEVAKMVAGDEAQLIMVNEMISRIAVQTCRQSGLSVVYIELLDFGGDEIYMHQEPALSGKTFADVLMAYEDSAVMGIRFADGRVALNPPMDMIFQHGDAVIAISEDDDTVKVSGLRDYGINESAILMREPEPLRPERTLILGWNKRAAAIIRELDAYVAPGSDIIIVADNDIAEEQIAMECPNLINLGITFQNANTTDRRVLDRLSVQDFDHIITLSYSDDLASQEADARTLITLLHLRDISDKTGVNLSIVSEMLDIRNRELAEVTRADDFIVSDKLISLMLSQVSENKDLMAVFTDLFDPEGSELYLKESDRYIQMGVPMNFYTVVDAARRRGEVAVGYRHVAQSGDASKAYGVVVNPKKSGMITFEPGDKVIVLAEN